MNLLQRITNALRFLRTPHPKDPDPQVPVIWVRATAPEVPTCRGVDAPPRHRHQYLDNEPDNQITAEWSTTPATWRANTGRSPSAAFRPTEPLGGTVD